MPGETDPGHARVQVDGHRGHGGKQLIRSSLADQYLLQAVQDLVLGHLRQYESTPGNAQRDAERRLVHAVPAHVPDEQLQVAGVGGDRVEEVPAEQGPVAARSIDGVQGGVGVVHQRLGEQPPLQAGRLGLAQLDLAQQARVLVGALALDGVADRPAERGSVDGPLDQVVLGALGNRRDA